ncbi:MAG: hypothetical protein J7L11_08485 [Thermoprotei archaeon]|nr:hypothetical protein [Thermoprotei archaeon]
MSLTRRNLNFMTVEDPITALSICLGASVTGCRAALALSSQELFEISSSLHEVVLSGIRGSLLILTSPSLGFDPRLAASCSSVLYLEPLNVNDLSRFMEIASELSEAIEVPIVLGLPEFDFLGLVDIEVSSVRAEPVFSKHWEFPHRWMHESFVRNVERRITLSKIYERLFSEFEFNVIPEDLSERSILCAGYSYSYVTSYLQGLGKDTEISVLGISIFAPLHMLSSPPSWFKSLSDHVKELLVVELGEPILENYMRTQLFGRIQIKGKADLKRHLTSYVLVRHIVSDFLKLRDPTIEYLVRVEGLIPPQLPPLSSSVNHLVEILKTLLARTKGLIIVNAISCPRLRCLLNEVLISKAKADYDVKSRRYAIKLPVDVIDIAYRLLSPLGLGLGEIMAGFRGRIVVVTTIGDLARNHVLLDKLGKSIVLVLDDSAPISARLILGYVKKRYGMLRVPIWDKNKIISTVEEYLSSDVSSPLVILLLFSG